MATPAPDISQLSEAQQLALQQYTSVTDSDIPAAISLLQRSEWNAQACFSSSSPTIYANDTKQIAITKFFDGEGPDPVQQAIEAQNAAPLRTSRQENLQESLLRSTRTESPHDLAPRIVPHPEQGVFTPPLIIRLLFTPFTLLYKLFGSTFGFLGYLFPFLPRLLQRNPNPRRTKYRSPLKPRDAVARLKREFEEEYGPNRIPFFEGGYAQALDKAKSELKFLLVLLLSPEHDDTPAFIHDTLISERIQQYVNDPSKIVLWVGDVRDAEAYEVSTALHCTKFPFTAVVAHDPKVGSTAMHVIERITGPMDANTYLARLQKAVNSHDAQLADMRATRSANDFSRNIREAQDTAYERSLAADRERKRAKEAAEAEAAAAAQREKEDAEAAERQEELKQQWRRWRASQIGAEPDAQVKDVVRIALKMPEAARIMRKFRSSDGIEELYAFVECYDLVKDGAVDEKAEKPSGYEHKFDFRLVQTLPRVVFEVEGGGTIGERVGKSGNLIVEPILADDDDDE